MRRTGPVYSTARPEGSLVVRPIRPGFWNRGPSKPKPLDVPRPFLGRPLFASRFAFPHRSASSRVALEDDRHVRRLIPAGSNQNPKVLIIACRRRSDLWSPAASCPRCRFLKEAGTAVPITCSPCTALPSRESEIFAFRPVDNGDIGQNRRNSPRFAKVARFGCRFVPLRLLRCRAKIANSRVRARLFARPQPAAARGGADHRRAGAGPRRRRHRQDRGADRPARPPHRHPPRLAVRDPRRHLHQQGGARDARARRRGSSARRSRACPGSAPSIRSRRKMLRRHAELVGLQSNFTILDTDDQLRAAEAADQRRRPRREALAGAPARRADRPLEEQGLDPRPDRCRRERGLRQRQGRRALRALSGAAEGAQRLRFRRPAAAHAGHPQARTATCSSTTSSASTTSSSTNIRTPTRPVSLAPPARPGAQEHLLRRRRRPVDLFLARRRGRQHPAVREGLSRAPRSSGSSRITARPRTSSPPPRA